MINPSLFAHGVIAGIFMCAFPLEHEFKALFFFFLASDETLQSFLSSLSLQLQSIPPYLWFDSLLSPLPINFPILSPSDPTLSEYGPHRLPVSLVCRRLQRLLLLSDPPGQGRRTIPSIPVTSRPRSSAHTAAAAAASDTGPPAGYRPLIARFPALL